ncbi:hypothetical protein LSCM1_06436 [Leishmania martiniquensis]|uniref:Treble clef zinc finger domain-containing protein n=1 Tax=Leishmania martiniquensis TaxID=1580590 RepID=A0A836GRJ3_9TRYP|nr:hypothetical protein LSCM1_06436 [Leishmania martiniquensis]
MRRTQRSLEAGMPVALRTWMQPRLTEKAGVQTSSAGIVRRSSTMTAATPDCGAAAPSTTTTRPVRRLRLAVVRPDLLDDWVPELNDVAAQQISCDEGTTLVWWRCSRCQEQYQCTVQTRVALGRAACPHCGGSTNATGDASSSNSAAVPAAFTPQKVAAPCVEAGEALDKTHPDIAARWDFARNGTLLPSHVTASSTRPVWWLPAVRAAPLPPPAAQQPRSSAQHSFLRPVFAFVHNSAGPEEQAVAAATMERRLLHEIRQVAHIEDAEQAGTIPVTLGGGQDSAANRARRLAGANNAATAADAHVVARLWKDRMSQLSRPENVAVSTAADLSASRVAIASPRGLFAHSPTGARKASASAGAVAASAVREAFLGHYFDFVRRRRKESSRTTGEKQVALTPILASLTQSSSAAAASTAAEGAPPSWINFFALTRDSVLPKGHIDASAALYFPEAVETTAADAAAISVSASGKADSLRLALSQVQPSVLIEYPRRPASPRLREDDVMQATPPMMSDGADDVGGGVSGESDASLPHASKSRLRSLHASMPFGHVTTVEGEKAAKLSAEYDVDDNDLDSGSIQRADDASAFAAELRSAQRASHTSAGGAGRHLVGAATATSLVDSAIAALGDVFSAAGVDNRSRRYHREAHRTPALSDELMASSNLNAQRAGKTQRRFRLSLPQAAQMRRGSAAVGSIGADAGAAVQPIHFDSPQAPRKVARPRRIRASTE